MLFELPIFLKAHFTKQAAEAIGMIPSPGHGGQDALAGADARAPGGVSPDVVRVKYGDIEPIFELFQVFELAMLKIVGCPNNYIS
jgi:hypothetical protein